MEALSGLPALKTIFPEHFYEQVEQGMSPSHPNSASNALFTHLNESNPPSQLQQHQLQQQHHQLQFGFNDSHYGQQYQQMPDQGQEQGNTRGGAMDGDRRAPKRSYDAAYGHPHPQQAQAQPQDPYNFNIGPSGPMPFSYPAPSGSLAPDGDVSGGDDLEADDGEADDPNGEKRRHPCPRCGKRFNRPSSLKIHINTHTGAKPYTCPFPGCGRTFNVSSNMRRHFRNHAHRPPPPPLPQSGTIYPAAVPTQIPAPPPGTLPPIRTRGRPTEQNPSLALPMSFDNGGQFNSDARSGHLGMGMYPPSDIRSNTAGVKGKGTGRGRGRPRKSEKNGNANGSLMTPPYTNEGSEFERDEENGRNLYAHAQMTPYGSFGPGPGQPQQLGENGNGLFTGGPPQIGMELQMQMNMPILMNGNPNISNMQSLEPFPVDPALSGSGGAAELDADADAEGEVDADGEFDHEADGERNGGEHREDILRRPGPSTSNTRSSSDPTANANVPFSLQTPSNNYMSLNSTGQWQYVQQYETHYTGQYGQHQQMVGSNANGAGQMHMQHDYSPYNQFPPHHQQQKSAQPNEHRHMSNGSEHSQRASRDPRTPEKGIGNDKVSSSASITPGAAPAPPYKLYTYPPPAPLEGADDAGNSDTGSAFEDNDDDEDYTGKSATKRGRGAAKRGTTMRGKPRGRPRGTVKASGRGRGRPRKNPLPVGDDAEAADEVGDTDEDVLRERLLSDVANEVGRGSRKRQRVGNDSSSTLSNVTIGS